MPTDSFWCGPLAGEEAHAERQYSNAVNPRWTRLLQLLHMDVRYERGQGAELFTADGRRILDFSSGHCGYNLGHNHPSIVAALKDEQDRLGPVMPQSHALEHAGALTEKLCALAGDPLTKAFFCGSGSEGIEAAVQFARSHTRRNGLLYAEGAAFHGSTGEPLSLMGNPFWKQEFGPRLTGTQQIPFDDLAALEQQLRNKSYAAFLVEPIQGEGAQLPAPGYLPEASALCKQYGALLILNEVQTAFFRTGPFLASQHDPVEADIIVFGEGLSGGTIPSGAVLMTDVIYHAVYGSLKRSPIHTAASSENGLAMRLGLAVLKALLSEKAGARSIVRGAYLRQQLQRRLSGFEMVEEVRGEGLLTGIAFRAPRTPSLKLAYEASIKTHPMMFGQTLVVRLLRDYGILTQICKSNGMVLKLAPALMVTESQIDEAVEAVYQVVELAHSSAGFWSETLDLTRRAANISWDDRPL